MVFGGVLHEGLEVEVAEGAVQSVRASRAAPEPWVLCPPFVNAHSHFEYRDLMGRVPYGPFAQWVLDLVRLKSSQTSEGIVQSCRLAASENRRTGVAWVEEHSDRPGSASAMCEYGLLGRVYQEVITLREPDHAVMERAAQRCSEAPAQVECTPNPHALYTVSPSLLAAFGCATGRMSIHTAESEDENLWLEKGEGRFREFRLPYPHPGVRAVQWLAELGLLRPGVQLVHACDLNDGELALVAASGVQVAHCPRSNRNLLCPNARVAELLEAGIQVGLGLDSAASSGPIDMFAEMRAAGQAAKEDGHSLTHEQVLHMATEGGAQSVGASGWAIEPGRKGDLLRIHVDVPDARQLIEMGSPEKVEWLSLH